MNWRPIQDVPHTSCPTTARIGSGPTVILYRKTGWMDAAVGGTAVQRLALLSHSKKDLRLNLMAAWGLSVRSLHVPHVPVWVLSKFSAPPPHPTPQPKDIHVRLTADSLNDNVSMNYCVWCNLPRVSPG